MQKCSLFRASRESLPSWALVRRPSPTRQYNGETDTGLCLCPARRQFDADSAVFADQETGLTFASYTSDRGITFRVAIPDVIPDNKVFDTVLQIVAPKDLGWAGWAWGGHMTYNPLAVVWANGTNNVVLSSRIA